MIMEMARRQYGKEQKEELIKSLLFGEMSLKLGKEHNISAGLINRWGRQYLKGELDSNNNQEIKNLQAQIAKLEQMIGELTMENYLLKKSKNIFSRRKKEDSFIITGHYLNLPRKGVS